MDPIRERIKFGPHMALRSAWRTARWSEEESDSRTSGSENCFQHTLGAREVMAIGQHLPCSRGKMNCKSRIRPASVWT